MALKTLSVSVSRSPSRSLLRLLSSFRLWSLAVAVGLLSLGGCRTLPQAHYVSQAYDHGVVGFPKDTPENRKKAEALMTAHFPEGYEVLWEGEEFVPGLGAYQPRDPLSDVSAARRSDPAFAAGDPESNFQRDIEDLPGTPQNQRGYAEGAGVPSKVAVAGVPSSVNTANMVGEWRITYRKRGSTFGRANPLQIARNGESLFPGGSGGNAVRAASHEVSPLAGVVPDSEHPLQPASAEAPVLMGPPEIKTNQPGNTPATFPRTVEAEFPMTVPRQAPSTSGSQPAAQTGAGESLFPGGQEPPPAAMPWDTEGTTNPTFTLD